MSNLHVYNSLTRKIEKFEPLQAPQVKMYCCGPTVYDFLHVGNFRGAVFYNFLRNWLEHSGYQVTMVYNYTDIDDKIINRAKAENVSSTEISERFIQEFEKDFASLKLRKHDFNPKVSTHIEPIIAMVKELIEKKKAYVVNGEVLYSIKSFSEYGKLSGRNPDELIAGTRVEVDEKKQNPLDFTLWKPSKPGEPSWPSPWGAGRPGWHIECSAMIKTLLGESIDIHGGGSDLIFPHHENEVAQSEGCTEKTLARYWIHNNMFTFSGQKMSKSLGNILKARDFIKTYNAEIFKYMVLSVHYRSLAEFSEHVAELATKALARIYSALSVAQEYVKDPGFVKDLNEAVVLDAAFQKQFDDLWNLCEKAMDDDFATPEVFAKIFDSVRVFNAVVKRGTKNSPIVKARALIFSEFLNRIGKVLSLFQESPAEFLMDLDNRLLEKMNLKRDEVEKIVQERFQFRKNKDFKKSDELRIHLTKMGISVSDTPEGSYWEVEK
jgi:cysteinyl-tRNA synthetase